ncbi:MAG: peptidoglycan DD-metalloendopeptidase family protein [Methylosarcina sp.]
MSGCTPRADLAPVVLHNQRFSSFNQEIDLPYRNWQLEDETAVVNEQNGIDANKNKVDNSVLLAEGSRKTNSPRRPSETAYQDTKQRKIPPFTAAHSGEQSKMANFRPSLEPPHPQKAEDPNKQGNALAEDQARIQDDKSKHRAEKPAGRSQNTSINSTNKAKKTEKRLRSEPIDSTNKHSKQIKLKKKSDISIDNKNMLMLNFQWPLKGKIKKSFSQTDNKGIDIIGNHGQTVRAAEAGKVVYSGQGLIGFGNLLIIKHNDDYLSAYANNSSLIVKEGQRVRKGQDIAKLGAALSKKAILHFEIRKNGKSVNPLSLLPNK